MAQAGSNWTRPAAMFSHCLIEFKDSKGPMKHVEKGRQEFTVMVWDY